MSGTRLVSVRGLAFGDCGKGLFVDALCRRWNAHTVVRFNGGAQAGHNVVLPDGRHHTFSQFGAGTFIAGVATLLAYPVVVHPTALLIEDAELRRKGIQDGLRRMLIDGRCRVSTPFHQAAGRLRELARGAEAHGSCGAGVGETVSYGLAHPDGVLRYADLLSPDIALPTLERMRRTLRADFSSACPVPENRAAYMAEMAVLDDESMARRWLIRTRELTDIVRPATRATVAARLCRPGVVLFEGAQGMLLDEWRGFHPHTTWSELQVEAIEAVVADAGQTAPLEHLGVLRPYLTRHGNGPLPTCDAALDSLAEPHNADGGWQGRFRRGHPDALLLRYALDVAAPLDGLLVSHLDVFDRPAMLRWCRGYAAIPQQRDSAICRRDAASGLVTALRPGSGQDLRHQALLTQLLNSARPVFETAPVASADQFIARVEGLAGLPVLFASFGPSHEAVTTHPSALKSSSLNPARRRASILNGPRSVGAA